MIKGLQVFNFLMLVVIVNFAGDVEARVILKRAKVDATTATSSLPNCYENFDPSDQMEEVNLPEVNEVEEETGIQILFLKSNVACQYAYSSPPIRYEFRVQNDVAGRTEFARKIANFLKSFPKDFLQTFRGTRFVLLGGLVNESSDHESDAVTSRKTIYIKTETVPTSVAHEFMHVFDSINSEVTTESITTQTWFQATPTEQCNYNSAGGEPLNFLARTYNQCFVSGYAQSNNLEDRAEIFRGITEDHAGMMDLASLPGSGLLSVKIAALKSELIAKSSKLNEAFWTSRLKGNFYGSYETCSGTPRSCTTQSFPARHSDWD